MFFAVFPLVQLVFITTVPQTRSWSVCFFALKRLMRYPINRIIPEAWLTKLRSPARKIEHFVAVRAYHHQSHDPFAKGRMPATPFEDGEINERDDEPQR